MKNYLNALVNRIVSLNRRLQFYKYRKSIPKKIAQIRNKEQIKVGFILHETALWKTEKLYLAMNENPRFIPQIYTTLSKEGQLSESIEKYKYLLKYLQEHSYDYQETLSIKDIDSDIVFYEKSYDFSYFEDIQAHNFKGIICTALYGFCTMHTRPTYNVDSILRSFQFYIENEYVKDSLKTLMDNRAENTVITGVPMMDILMESKTKFINPWKIQDKPKKRIIWAPHFTIHKGVSWLDLSSFSMMYEEMLKFASKYEDNVQIAFKPHPLLFSTLVNEWGYEKAKEYFNQWENMPNGQLETGEYVGLFLHSDAMIHDCGSFLIEYLYTEKPVMYTVRDIEKTVKQYNKFAKEAFNQLYIGSDNSDVENFIKDVIKGWDPKLEQRKEFKRKFLLPPNGKTASENIIDSILGLKDGK